ncbi:MAG: hypothetical protein ACREJ3_16505 [Polyangiaceae bacterium]
MWASAELNEYVDFPHVGQVFVLRRTVVRAAAAVPSVETCCGITSLRSDQACPQRLLRLSRGHWAIENELHWVRDVTFDEDRSQVRKGHAPQTLATLRNVVIGLLRVARAANIAAALRYLAARTDDILRLVGLRAPRRPSP